jgi:hypothetical protein
MQDDIAIPQNTCAVYLKPYALCLITLNAGTHLSLKAVCYIMHL